MPFLFSEAEYEDAIIELYQQMGYDYVYGPNVVRDYTDPLYQDVLTSSIENINRDLPSAAIQEALRKIQNMENGTVVRKNTVFMDYLQNGVPVRYFHNGEERSAIVKLIDYENVNSNNFVVANQWTIEEGKDEKRPDVIVFINGIPVVVIELKSPTRDVVGWRDAYNQIRNYLDKIPLERSPLLFPVSWNGRRWTVITKPHSSQTSKPCLRACLKKADCSISFAILSASQMTEELKLKFLPDTISILQLIRL